MIYGSVENHREREKGVLVYPVYSRRSGGLSVGINFFPDKKNCSFDCPYCEVFPFTANAEFSLPRMEEDLRAVIALAREQNVTVKDICFSGNGEPSLSPDFPSALELAAAVRAELAPDAELVLITNGGGLLNPRLFDMLRQAALDSPGLNIWLKLDAGTPGWYRAINRTVVPFDRLIARIKEFAACAPVTIQSMCCMVDGEAPPLEEEQAWIQSAVELSAIARENGNGGIRKFQIYGKVRPAPEDPKAAALPAAYLEARAAVLRQKLEAIPGNFPLPEVEVY